MYKVVRSSNYSIECWLVVDDNGNIQGSFNNWMDASNYAMSLHCKGSYSSNGFDLKVATVATEDSSKLNITHETLHNVSKHDFEKTFIDGALYGYTQALIQSKQHISKENDAIIGFARNILCKEEVDEEIQKVINEHFWDMI